MKFYHRYDPIRDRAIAIAFFVDRVSYRAGFSFVRWNFGYEVGIYYA